VELAVTRSGHRDSRPHINIPFGGVLKSPRYLMLCAALGIRGVNQENFTADQVVEFNCHFLTHGVNYLSGWQTAELLHRIFGEFEYVEDASDQG
jgi:hypothetical protein